jgi:hypothetical protein
MGWLHGKDGEKQVRKDRRKGRRKGSRTAGFEWRMGRKKTGVEEEKEVEELVTKP